MYSDTAAATVFATDTISYLQVDPIAVAAVGVRVCDGAVDGDAQVEVVVSALGALGRPRLSPANALRTGFRTSLAPAPLLEGRRDLGV